MLAEKNIPYAIEMISPFRPPDYFASISPLKRIPVLRDMDAQKLAAGLQPGSPLVANLDGFPWRAQLPALAPRIISQIDGRRSVAEIYTSLSSQGSALASASAAR